MDGTACVLRFQGASPGQEAKKQRQNFVEAFYVIDHLRMDGVHGEQKLR